MNISSKLTILLLIIFGLTGCATSQALHLKRQEIINRHSEWPEEKKQLVLNGSIYLGMTKEEVTAIWDAPGLCDKTVSAFGTMETCSYDGGSKYLIYQNDKLSSWHES